MESTIPQDRRGQPLEETVVGQLVQWARPFSVTENTAMVLVPEEAQLMSTPLYQKLMLTAA